MAAQSTAGASPIASAVPSPPERGATPLRWTAPGAGHYIAAGLERSMPRAPDGVPDADGGPRRARRTHRYPGVARGHGVSPALESPTRAAAARPVLANTTALVVLRSSNLALRL